MRKKEDLENRKLSLKNIKRLYRYFKDSKGVLIIILIFTIIKSVLGVLIPLLSANLVLYLTDELWRQLLITAGIIMVINMVTSFFSIFEDKLTNRLHQSVDVAIQTNIAKELLELEVSELDAKSTGVFVERLNNDARGLSHQFMMLTWYLSNFLTSMGVLVSIFILSKIMFLYLLVFAIISFYFQNKRIKKQNKLRKDLFEINENNTGLASEIVRGVRDLKVLNAKKNILKKTKESILNSSNRRIQIFEVGNFFYMITGFINEINDFLFFVLGMVLVTNNLLATSSLLILYNYRGRIGSFFSNVIYLIDNLKQFDLEAERVFEIIDDGTFKKETFGTKHLDKFDGNIKFDNVTFGYNDDKLIIDKMSFEIKPNERVAFVGKSGAGKSTIFSLISKLYPINDGHIYLDGIDLNELDESSIRDNMSLITQEPYIFNFSIKDNLLLAKVDATDEEMIEACKTACIHDYIETLPDKYDTLMGENGVILSGGQKQRLAIARALLMKTEIILFDEATSALDNETQDEITKAIDNLKGEYTILIVAHRLSTVINCDRIFVVDDGKIIETGTHKELIKNSKFYKHLYEREL